jgi:hypothetical protein
MGLSPSFGVMCSRDVYAMRVTDFVGNTTQYNNSVSIVSPLSA